MRREMVLIKGTSELPYANAKSRIQFRRSSLLPHDDCPAWRARFPGHHMRPAAELAIACTDVMACQ